jgi:D-lactate dehydrogenase
MQMKIAVFELEEWERGTFQKLGKEHEVLMSAKNAQGERRSRFLEAEVISPFIYSKLDARVLARFKNLKLIATRSTGFDHIDLDYCKQHHVTVCSVPTYADQTVAEHVFALLLAISHRIPEAVSRTQRGNFSQEGLQGFDLCGKTLGVVGTGNIGRHVIKIARGLGMEVIAFDVRPDEAAASQLGFTYATMDDLFARADIITLHVPGGKKTRHLISRAAFEKMKDGVVLINTARGEVVDVQALMEAIVHGKIRAAGLDVLPDEPVLGEETELLRSIFVDRHNLDTLLAGHMLCHLSNVLITPHSAFNTREAVQRLLDTTVQNIVAFARGEPQNVAV